MFDRDHLISLVPRQDFQSMMDRDVNSLTKIDLTLLLRFAAEIQGEAREPLLALVCEKLRSGTNIPALVFAALENPFPCFLSAVRDAHGIDAFRQAETLQGAKICPVAGIKPEKLTADEVLEAFTILRPAASSHPYDLLTIIWNSCKGHGDADLLDAAIDLFGIDHSEVAWRMMSLSPWTLNKPALTAWSARIIDRCLSEPGTAARQFLSIYATRRFPHAWAIALASHPSTIPMLRDLASEMLTPDDYVSGIARQLENKHTWLLLTGRLAHLDTPRILAMKVGEITSLALGTASPKAL